MLDDLPPPEITREDLPLKSPSMIYPPPKLPGRFTPQIVKYDLPPPRKSPGAREDLPLNT